MASAQIFRVSSTRLISVVGPLARLGSLPWDRATALAPVKEEV